MIAVAPIDPAIALHHRLAEALYCDTMLLADEARDYGEHHARADLLALDPLDGVLFSCESLRLTTRLMHLLGWLIGQRAVAAGERSADDRSTRLVIVAPTEPRLHARLPERAAVLIETSELLYRRAAALDAALVAAAPPLSPARAMQQRLAIALR